MIYSVRSLTPIRRRAGLEFNADSPRLVSNTAAGPDVSVVDSAGLSAILADEYLAARKVKAPKAPPPEGDPAGGGDQPPPEGDPAAEE